MKVNRSIIYAIQALLVITRRKGSRPVSSPQLAEAHGIPQRVLVRTLKQLVRAGLLRSALGQSGGCSVARPAEDISLLDIIEAVDGPILTPEPRADGRSLDPRLTSVCAKVKQAVRGPLQKVTLADLAGK